MSYSLSSPTSAEASFSLSSVFTNTTEAADIPVNDSSVRTISSQNVALLLAAVTSDPASAAVDADINIVNNSALMADSGPLGTIADVNDEVDVGVDSISVYVVRSGDTIGKIANMFGVSANTIIWGNDLKGSKDIKVGQELVILPVNGIKYTIKKGDTIASIAKKSKGDVDEILRFNNMEKGQKLAIGDEIIIPDGQIVLPPIVGSTNVIKTNIDGAIDSIAYFIKPVVNGRKTQGLHGKNGVDIAPGCRCVGKESLLASAAGSVLVAKNGGWNGGYGNYVVISHSNGTQTVYGHMHFVTTYAGAYVAQGQVIGTVGSSGKSTGPHVHFEIRGAKNPF
ncbi:MAG: M23 family metallopeptidase [bacterium]|nr:M23 family metallopeptidase [bacterium]